MSKSKKGSSKEAKDPEPEALDLIDLSPSPSKDAEIGDKSEAFSFWGATKKSAPASRGEIAIADKAKLLEQTSNVDTFSKTSSSMKAAASIAKKPVGGKIADRLKAFESPKEVLAPPPPPPAPDSPPPDKKKSSLSKSASKSVSKKDKDIPEEKPSPKKSKAVPGSFPDDEVVEPVEMPVAKKSSKTSKSTSKAKDSPKEVPKEDPIVESPPTPPPEPKSSKKERPRVVRDGSSWGAWGAAAAASSPSKEVKEEKKSSKESKSKSSSKRPEKEEKTSSKDSSSDKADKPKSKTDRPPISRGMTSMFGGAPSLSRSNSERRTSTSGKSSSRRQSVAEGSGLISPPPEMSSKAAKLLGLTPGKLSRSKSEKHKSSRGMLPSSPANVHLSMTDNLKAPEEDEDIVIVGANGASPPPEKSSRDRKSKSKVFTDPIAFSSPPPAVPMPPGDNDLPYRRPRMPKDPRADGRSKQTKPDEDIVMVDAGGPSENEPPALKRSDSSAKKAGLGGMFGGLLSKARPDNKRRGTAVEEDGPRGLRREDRKVKREDVDRDVTMSGGAAEEDQEAKRAARRAARKEQEALLKAADDARNAKDDERRARRRKQEEEMEARQQEEKDLRRAARREQKAQAEADRQASEAKEAERLEKRRARRSEKEATQTDGEQLTEGPERLKRSDRRKSHMDGPADDDEERRRRREERRAARGTDTPKTSRRQSAPVVDGYFDSRNGSRARDTEKDSKRKKAGWPHSGTDSWVAETSDAPPPPDKGIGAADETEDGVGGEKERSRMRKTRRQSKYGDETEEDPEERRKRRESRRQERGTVKSSEGSQGDGRRPSRRDSGFVDSRAPSAQGGIFGRLKRMI